MLSSPIGLGQQGMEEFERLIVSVSIASVPCGFMRDRGADTGDGRGRRPPLSVLSACNLRDAILVQRL
jgi:hypothetical protein